MSEFGQLKVPLHGMVGVATEKVSTPYTEIAEPPEIPPRSTKTSPPDLPPRCFSNDNGSSHNSPPFKQSHLSNKPKSVSLTSFATEYGDWFPIHVRVTQGHYGSSNFETLSNQQELVVLCEKKREVLRIRSKSGKMYSLPHGSSIPISLLYNPDDNEEKALSGVTFESLSALPQNNLPKILSCSVPNGKLPDASHEILVVNNLDTSTGKLCVQCIPNMNSGQSASKKELDLNYEAHSIFTTKPDLTALYLSEIIKYVHSPCMHNPKALLHLKMLSSSNFDNVMLNDRKLSEPVELVKQETEYSLVVVRADVVGSSEEIEYFEIPLDDKFAIEFTVLCDEDSTYSMLDPPNYPSLFDLSKLRLWITDSYQPSHAVQQIFNSSLRSGHEMEGIDIPQERYDKIAQKKTVSEMDDSVVNSMPVSVPVSGEISAPPRPPKQKSSRQLPSPVNVEHSPQQSSGLILSSPSTVESVESPTTQDITKTREFKELLDKAIREKFSPYERLLSISSSDSAASPLEFTLLHEKRHSDKLTPDDLCQILTELADCEGQWFYLAIYLGVPKSRVDLITATHNSDPRRGLIEAVSYWLDNSTTASWSSIVKALYMLEKKNKARELAEKYDADIPSSDSSTNHTALNDDLSPEQKEEVKKIERLMEQKSDERQDAHRNIAKHKQKLEHLECELVEVKKKLEFNEEYALILMHGSQIASLKQGSPRDSTSTSGGKDKLAYGRRKQHVQAEMAKLQRQLFGMEHECQMTNRQLQVFQAKKDTLSQELIELEERLAELVMGTHGVKTMEEAELESPEYYNIILKNGVIEQKLHQKEITQLQEALLSKEEQLEMLKKKLEATQESLTKVESKISSQYDYVAQDDAFVQDENVKTSLQADRVDYRLKMVNLYFAKTEVSSKLKTRENKIQRSKQINQLIQSKMEQVKGSKKLSASEESDDSLAQEKPIMKPKKKSSREAGGGGVPRNPANPRYKFSSQSTRVTNRPKPPEGSRARAETDVKQSRSKQGIRPRTGATAAEMTKQRRIT